MFHIILGSAILVACNGMVQQPLVGLNQQAAFQVQKPFTAFRQQPFQPEPISFAQPATLQFQQPIQQHQPLQFQPQPQFLPVQPQQIAPQAPNGFQFNFAQPAPMEHKMPQEDPMMMMMMAHEEPAPQPQQQFQPHPTPTQFQAFAGFGPAPQPQFAQQVNAQQHFQFQQQQLQQQQQQAFAGLNLQTLSPAPVAVNPQPLFQATTPAPASPSEPVYLGTFTKARNNVEGDVFMLDESTLYIQGFSFDGQAPDVYFWSEGVPIPYYTRSDPTVRTVVSALNKEDVVLLLPPEKPTVHQMGKFTIWCRLFDVTFGEFNMEHAHHMA